MKDGLLKLGHPVCKTSKFCLLVAFSLLMQMQLRNPPAFLSHKTKMQNYVHLLILSKLNSAAKVYCRMWPDSYGNFPLKVIKGWKSLIRKSTDANYRACKDKTHTHSQSLTKFHEYSLLHKLCLTSVNSRQTFSQNTHADHLTLPFSCLTLSISLLLCLSLRPLHQPHSLSITICLIVFSLILPKLSVSTSLDSFMVPAWGPHYFSPIPNPLPFHCVSAVLTTLIHMVRFDDHSHHDQTPSTCMTSSSLNYPPLNDTAWGTTTLSFFSPLTIKTTPHMCLYVGFERGFLSFGLITEASACQSQFLSLLLLTLLQLHQPPLPLCLFP